MKTIEEKARAYDKAIKIAKKYWNSPRTCFDINALTEMFPELKESEDERIRGAITHFISHTPTVPKGIINKEQMLAWLEKQGEKLQGKSALEAAKEDKVDSQNCVNPADKIETQFKVGDWITNDYCAGKVIELTNDAYLLNTGQGIPFSCEHNVHLWTIQDAKDGDVLSYRDGQWIFIYKKQVDDNSFHYYSLYSTIHQDLTIDDSASTLLGDAIIPATKEQRDLLFQKMHEAGYTFDFKKKEVKKLKFKVGDEIITENEESLTITRIDEEGYWSNDLFICSFDDSAEWKLVEQKYHMTDEDKAEIDYCFTKMMNGEKVSSSEEEYNGEDYGIDGLWHAMNILERTLGKVSGYQTDDGFLSHQCAITAVKKLYEQKPTKWSNEDEYMLNETIQHLEELIRIDKAKHLGCDVQYYQRDIDWLKRIKQRIGG